MATREIPRVITYVCDRCKGEAEMKGLEPSNYPKGWVALHIGNKTGTTYHHLCVECKDALWRFLQIHEVKAAS